MGAAERQPQLRLVGTEWDAPETASSESAQARTDTDRAAKSTAAKQPVELSQLPRAPKRYVAGAYASMGLEPTPRRSPAAKPKNNAVLPTRSRDISAQFMSSTMSSHDPRWALAAATWRALQGSLLTSEDRDRIMRWGRAMGMTNFQSSLIIAVVQDQARRGGTLGNTAPMLQRISSETVQPAPTYSPPTTNDDHMPPLSASAKAQQRWRTISNAFIIIGLEAIVLLGLWRLIS